MKNFTTSEKFPTDTVLICGVMFIAVGTFDNHHFSSSGNDEIQADSHFLNETSGPVARVGGFFLDKTLFFITTLNNCVDYFGFDPEET